MTRTTYLDSSSDDEEETKVSARRFKIIVIGERKVGKTSLINRIHNNKFTINYNPTNYIEIHSNVKMGDIYVDIWDIPPNMCKYYRVNSLQSDAIVLMFNSNFKDTLDKGIELWKRLHKKLYMKHTPEMWFVYRGQPMGPIEECHPDRLFHINNMSREGLLDLIYDIRCNLIKKY